MEVHHHTHTSRKKWAHYFWEFLMLFLAVTLGFFVENQREHYIEHKRAKQYASFLRSDLVNDTTNLSERIRYINSGIKGLDSLIFLLKSFNPDTFAEKIYSLPTYAFPQPIFTPNNSTIEQLKSSGSLRYFRDTSIIRNFSSYDNEIQNIKTVEERNFYITESIRKFLTQFLDLRGVPLPRILASDSVFFQSQTQVHVILRLYKKDPAQFEQYANLRIRLMNRTLNSARNLILSLKEEYHLE